MSSLIPAGLGIVRHMPRSLRRDYAARSDAAIRNILERCGAPRMRHAMADALLASPLRAGLFGGPHLCLPAGWDDEGPAFDPASFDSPGPARTGPRPAVERLPYSLYSETSLAASSATGVGSATDYQNPSGYPFWITHVGFAMDGTGTTDLRVDPTYSVRLTPTRGRPWMASTKMPAAAIMTYRTQWGPPQNSLPLCVFDLAQEYVMDKQAAIEATAENPSSAGAIRADIAFVAYKRNREGSIRILTDTLTLAASAAATHFSPENLRGDGDWDLGIRQVVMSAGLGDWYAAAHATAPRYYVRPTGADYAFTRKAAMAPCLNTAEGGTLGGHLRLATPQLLPPNGSMTIEFTENDGVARVAAVSLIGYLEKVVAYRDGAQA